MPLIIMPPYQQQIAAGLVISANTANYNIAAAFGNPTSPINAVITINSGVIVYSNASATPALVSGALPAGSTVTLINNGSIYGAGGDGSNCIGCPGLAGGDAISTSVPITIDNTNGYIFGGGGGGEGGGWYYPSYGWEIYSGGGGGQGFNSSVGNYAFIAQVSQYFAITRYATNGSSVGPGVGSITGYVYNTAYVNCYGGSGGSWGSPGNPFSQANNYAGATLYAYGAGVAGWSIRGNGYPISIIGGNNGNQIKGPAA